MEEGLLKKGSTAMVAVLVTLVFTLTLVGCSSKPDTISDKVYQCGQDAVSTAEKYLAGDLESAEAYEKIDEIYEKAKDAEDSSKDDDNLVISGISSLHTSLFVGSENDEIQERVDLLKRLME